MLFRCTVRKRTGKDSDILSHEQQWQTGSSCSEDYFSGFVERLKTEMLKEGVLHCDETYVKVLKEKEVSDNSKQYMWVYRTGKHSKRQIVIYDYNKSRSGDVTKKFLGEFSGYLHTDMRATISLQRSHTVTAGLT